MPLEPYVSAIYDLAALNGCPVIDWDERYGDFTKHNALRLLADLEAGYARAIGLVAN